MGFDLDENRDNKSVADVEVLIDKLAAYGTRKGMKEADPALLHRAYVRTMQVFGCTVGQVEPLRLGPGIADTLQLNRSAGLPVLGKKADDFKSDLARAERYLYQGKTPDPCMPFRRVQHGDTGPKTRLVWGYPQAMTILEAKFAPLLIERFLMSSTPMVFGLGKIQVGAKLTRIRNSNVRYSIDFSGFDASVPVGLIVRAFNILRTHFDFIDEEDDRAWEQVQNYFIHTPMMLPDQQVFQTSGGVPSGSYFTQLVDSIINYMCVQYMMLKVFGYFAKEDKALVLGDDAAIGVDEYRPLAQLASAFGDLGLKLNVGKTGVTRYRKGDVHFLGHYWPTCLPDRPVEEIVKRLAFQRRCLESRKLTCGS